MERKKRKKEVVFRVRLSRESYERLRSMASERGVSTAELVRETVLREVKDPEHCRACRRFLAVVVDLKRELNAIGRNLNQIARWVNTHKDKADAVKVMLLLSEIRRGIERLESRYDSEVSE